MVHKQQLQPVPNFLLLGKTLTCDVYSMYVMRAHDTKKPINIKQTQHDPDALKSVSFGHYPKRGRKEVFG